MKFNWGTGIFIFYSLFAISLFYQVYKSTQYDNSLVVDNYYEKDLNYQTQYDKIVNSQTLINPLKIDYRENEKLIELRFPKEIDGVTGTVLLYRAANKTMDVSLPIILDKEHKMVLNSEKFSDGFWRVEVDWNASGKDYFDKTKFNISR